MSTTARTLELLTLLQWPRVGPVKALEICKGTSRQQSLLENAKTLLPSVSDERQLEAEEKAEAILNRCNALGIQTIGIEDSAFPGLLREIPSPPPILYVLGSVGAISQPGIAVVGTRKVSKAGSRLALMIAKYVSTRGYSVVSGLALGVDTLAHEGALEANGTTVAVLAHGLDTVSPSSNRPLAERIMRCHGALVSEHPPGVPARPPEFVKRNRIQSGLSLGSIVVESAREGGAMHQAAFTRKQGRRLLTVLASSDETRGDLNEEGARHLVANLDATAIRSTSDLGRELDALTSHECGHPSPEQGILV